jgi:P-type Ca2+ transporter type 2C
MTNWHFISKEETLQHTNSQAGGLSVSQSATALKKHGHNVLLEKKKKPAWHMFLLQFKDTMILILLVAAGISAIVGDLKDTIVVLVIVVLNAIVGFVQEYRAEQAMEALKKMSPSVATVLRDGQPQETETSLLVPGDIVVLNTGDLVPADLRLLESVSLKIGEASLTGESESVEKQTEPLKTAKLPIGDCTNMAYKSTIVAYGRGSGIVVATGMKTEIGQIAQMLQEDDELTPLQKRLSEFSKKLSVIIVGICIIIYIVGVVRGEDPIKMLLTAISVAVAGIPEALPAVVTIALAIGARRLVSKKALIRKLPAVETLGSITFICTDKTGTLTQNKMTVTETWTDQIASNGPLSTQDTLLLCMALNHNIKQNEDGVPIGEPTELALAAFATANLTAVDPKKSPRTAELPFDADRKMMTTIHEWQDGKFLIVTKGALESILKICKNTKPDITLASDAMAENGLRVLAYAYQLVDVMPAEINFSNIEKDMQFVGLTGLMDPPRKEVARAIVNCMKAGIIPVMITGDHPKTATAIARQIGMLNDEKDIVISGAELEKMSKSAFVKKIELIRVYARVSPAQKLQIVKTLQAKHHFVAMTGDGVNDAPALRRADIGIAMGIMGTDVTKEAADMILLDDNFATIIKAVKEGRRAFANIRKSIKFLLTGNSGEIWTIVLAMFVGLPLPLLPIHILWINLVTDGLPAMALAVEPAEKDVMKDGPLNASDSIFAHGLGWHVLWVGFLIGAICFGIQFWALQHQNPKWQTYIFTVLCFSQLAYVMAVRSNHSFLFQQGIFSNPSLIGVVLFTFGLQLLVLYVPLFQGIFSTQALSLKELGICILAALLVFHAVELEKYVRGRIRKRKATKLQVQQK